MKILSLLLSGLFAPSAALLAQTPTGCPTSAVFLALPDQVRGYPTRANGPTAPCVILQGPQTTLTTANSVSVSVNGYLHVLQFLTNGTIAVFLPNANGNVAPDRIESVLNNDLIAEATDRQVNDFALSKRDGDAAISVTQPSTTRAEFAWVAPGFSVASALAIDKDDNLLVGGWDTDNNALIETLGTSTSLGSPSVIRQLTGPNTQIFPGDIPDFINNTMSIATDPLNGELYVYTYSPTESMQKILVFRQGASGNVPPVRVIAGPRTQIGPPGQLNNKIAVAADGRLYVAEANNRILVFAPGARGNVPPAQIIEDSTIGTTQVGAGGIGVRSCQCDR
ncbi:MAG TPA: hypothetical protein VFB43_00190 [Terracidiphilus sp.]|nr:hypothetical protein [Terracidiphilus sp.]